MIILDCMNEGQRNVTRFMFLTGLSASEIARIRIQDIRDDYLFIRNFKPRRRKSKQTGKTKYRRRKIKITKAIRECLNTAIKKMSHRAEEEGKEDYVFLSVKGKLFSCSIFYEYWASAIKRSGLVYQRPYSTRHTFAAWALAMGKERDDVIRLMGHGSRKMVYDVYGKWPEGLSDDIEDIRWFMGNDF